jgi:hypothetical protein
MGQSSPDSRQPGEMPVISPRGSTSKAARRVNHGKNKVIINAAFWAVNYFANRNNLAVWNAGNSQIQRVSRDLS